MTGKGYKNREGKEIRTGVLLHISATLFDMQLYQNSDPRVYSVREYSERRFKRSHDNYLQPWFKSGFTKIVLARLVR